MVAPKIQTLWSIAQASSAYRKAPQSQEPKVPNWELVDQYLPLLKSIVSKMRIYFPLHIDIQDIYSIAISGLIHAAQHFDTNKGIYFGKYASMRIRGALLDELRRMDLMPRSDRLKVKRYQTELHALEQEYHRAVTTQEIQERLALSKEDYAILQEKIRPISQVPLDGTLASSDSASGEGTWSFHDLVFDPTDLNGRDVAERKDLLKLLRKKLEQLPDMAKKVLILYYVEDLNLSEIAAVFELTESRICQIHTQALGMLRKLVQKSL